MSKHHLPGIFAMAIIVLTSNILVQFLFGQWLTWGAFTYPFAFLVTDIMNRVYGRKAAQQVILIGFIVGVFCSLVGAQIQGEFGPLVTFRIALASGIAFLVAQTLDVVIFDQLRNAEGWWKAPLTSTVIGSAVDTLLFFSIAFSAMFIWLEPTNDVSWAGEVLPMLGVGPEAPLWVSLAFADWLVKLSLAFVALVPFRLIVDRMLTRTT